MSSQAQVDKPGGTEGPPIHSSWVTTLLIIAIAVAAGFGVSYLVFTPDTGTDVDQEVAQVLDDFWAAADAGDVDGVNDVLVEGWATFFDYDSANWPDSVIRTRVEAWANVEGPSPVGEARVIEKPYGGGWEVVQRGTFEGEERFYYFVVVEAEGWDTESDADGLKILVVDDSPWVGLG